MTSSSVFTVGIPFPLKTSQFFEFEHRSMASVKTEPQSETTYSIEYWTTNLNEVNSGLYLHYFTNSYFVDFHFDTLWPAILQLTTNSCESIEDFVSFSNLEERGLRGLQSLRGVFARHDVTARGALLSQLQNRRPNQKVCKLQA